MPSEAIGEALRNAWGILKRPIFNFLFFILSLTAAPPHRAEGSGSGKRIA